MHEQTKKCLQNVAGGGEKKFTPMKSDFTLRGNKIVSVKSTKLYNADHTKLFDSQVSSLVGAFRYRVNQLEETDSPVIRHAEESAQKYLEIGFPSYFMSGHNEKQPRGRRDSEACRRKSELLFRRVITRQAQSRLFAHDEMIALKQFAGCKIVSL